MLSKIPPQVYFGVSFATHGLALEIGLSPETMWPPDVAGRQIASPFNRQEDSTRSGPTLTDRQCGLTGAPCIPARAFGNSCLDPGLLTIRLTRGLVESAQFPQNQLPRSCANDLKRLL